MEVIMRNSRLILVACITIALVAGFVAARPASKSATTSCNMKECDPVSMWLGLDATRSQQLRQLDPTFQGDYAKLRGDLQAKRLELARVLEDATSSDAMIRGHVDAAVLADHALERRIIDHLLAVRQQLTPAQQQKLFGLAAEGVRRGGGYCRNIFGSGPGAAYCPRQAPSNPK
jgi:Spy/CpxP family protein refolding chaperone